MKSCLQQSTRKQTGLNGRHSAVTSGTRKEACHKENEPQEMWTTRRVNIKDDLILIRQQLRLSLHLAKKAWSASWQKGHITPEVILEPFQPLSKTQNHGKQSITSGY